MVSFQENLSRIKDGMYMINLDETQSKGTHWVSLFINKYIAKYFDCFAIEYIPQEVLSKIRNNSIMHKILKMQDDDSISFGFFCIALI